MEMNNIFYEKDVAYYIPCMYPLIHEYMRNSNYNSYLSIHANLDLLGLPVLCKNEELKSYSVFAFDVTKLNYKSREENLGFTLERKEISNNENRLKALYSMLESKKSVIVSGTQYYLPYSNGYKAESYILNYPNPIFGIVNHWITVYGIENGEVLIRDTTLNYFGKIGLDDFLNFWAGDKNIKELNEVKGVNELLENGFADVELDKELQSNDYKELFLKTLKTIAYEYVTGKSIKEEQNTYFYGSATLVELINSIADSADQESNNKIWSAFNNCLFSFKFSRLIFRDFLLELEASFKDVYCERLSEFHSLLNEMENISYMYAVNLRRNKINAVTIQALIEKLSAYAAKEMSYFTELLNSYEQISLLEKKI